MTWTDDLLALRLETLSACAERGIDEQSREYEAIRLKQSLDGADTVERYEQGERVRAAVIVGRPTEAMLGLRDTPCRIHCGPGDEDAQTWAADRLVRIAPRVDDSFVAVLPPTQRLVLDLIEGRGYRTQALVLHGRPRTAFDRLGGEAELRRRRRAARDEHGLTVSPLSTADHVEQLVEQRRQFFTSNPQVSPISSTRTIDAAQQAQIDDHVRRSLTNGMQGDIPEQFIVTRSGDVVGGFGVVRCETSPIWGKTMGVEVFLNSSAQGKGLGTLIYLTMLHHMLALGVDTFRGTTANPAVIHLSRKMDRRLLGWKVVRGRPGAARVTWLAP